MEIHLINERFEVQEKKNINSFETLIFGGEKTEVNILNNKIKIKYAISNYVHTKFTKAEFYVNEILIVRFNGNGKITSWYLSEIVSFLNFINDNDTDTFLLKYKLNLTIQYSEIKKIHEKSKSILIDCSTNNKSEIESNLLKLQNQLLEILSEINRINLSLPFIV